MGVILYKSLRQLLKTTKLVVDIDFTTWYYIKVAVEEMVTKWTLKTEQAKRNQ